jgi:hypothetical protein
MAQLSAGINLFDTGLGLGFGGHSGDFIFKLEGFSAK